MTTTVSTTKVTSTTVSTTTQVVDLSNTPAASVFTRLEEVRAAARALAKEETALKAELDALTGWEKDETTAVAIVDGVEIFKKKIGKTTGIDRDVLKSAFAEAYAATYSEKPNFSYAAV
jgi:hypothetical protein